ncbi:MAG: hypothetical protein ACI93R_000806 [Flavobacteriales bacterium]|jgi:hypothetical protein
MRGGQNEYLYCLAVTLSCRNIVFPQHRLAVTLFFNHLRPPNTLHKGVCRAEPDSVSFCMTRAIFNNTSRIHPTPYLANRASNV